MPRSMTGYGRAELSEPGMTLAWEIKSVNSRFLDLKWRLPPVVRSQEAAFEKLIRGAAVRGRLDVYLHLQLADAGAFAPRLNIQVVQAMLDQVADLAKAQGRIFEPDLTRVLNMQSLWQDSPAEPDPALVDHLQAVLRQALDNWNQTRQREGQATVADLQARLAILNDLTLRIQAKVPQLVHDKGQLLAERIKTLLAEAGVNAETLGQERILQEIAVLADRLDVSEELTRLQAHLKELAAVLAQQGDVGKRLDFLLQETFREINTCGNKCQDAEVSRLVVEFKAELEKCREQVQNLE